MSTNAPQPVIPAAPQPPPRKRHTLRNVLVASGIGVVALIAIVATVSPSPKPAGSPAGSPATSPAVSVVIDPNGQQCTAYTPGSTYCPGDAPSPAAPQYTAAQQQAIDAATGYLSDGQGFSYNSLIQQLTSQYGNGFTQADATFAVTTLNPDWNAQAAAAAKGYMSDGQGFSCSSLLDQLTSQYGNGFTHAQAEYGVSSVGLGTC